METVDAVLLRHELDNHRFILKMYLHDASYKYVIVWRLLNRYEIENTCQDLMTMLCPRLKMEKIDKIDLDLEFEQTVFGEEA